VTGGDDRAARRRSALPAGRTTLFASFAIDHAIVDLVAAFLWNRFWFSQAGLVGDFIRDNAAAFGWD
jgi:hypothetical protein